MTETNPGIEDIEFESSLMELGLTDEEIKALFELPRIKKHKVAVKPASKLQAAPRHTLAPVRPSRHIFPMRSYQVELRARQAADKARRKAQREELKKFETTVTILGLSLLGELAKAITKPNEPVQSPSKEPDKNIIPDSEITDAVFRDIVDEPETKALSPGTQ